MKNIKSFNNLFEDEGGYLMSKSYQVTTPESAEAGDYEDQGMEYENKRFDTLWDMAQEIRDEGATEPSNSGNATKNTWYSTPDGDQNFHDGSVKYYSFHPKLNSDEEAQELFDMIKMDHQKFRQMDPSMQEGFQGGMHDDVLGADKYGGKKIDVDNELFEAFRRFLLNTARIDPKNITSIDAYNKYCIIHTDNDDPKRIDFKVGYNV